MAADTGGMLAEQSELKDEDAFLKGCLLLLRVARKDTSGVLELIDKSKQLVNFRDYDRRTPLHVAASEGNLHLVELLISKGARLNRSDRWGGSPLDDALRHRHHNVATYLRGAGARGGVRDHVAELISACAAGDISEMNALLDDGADPNGADYDKRTPLHLAAGEGPSDMVKILLDNGADARAQDRWGGTPLDDALNRGNKSDDPSIVDAIVTQLKAKGATAKTASNAAAKGGCDGSSGGGGSAKGSAVLLRARSSFTGLPRGVDSSLSVAWKDIELGVRLGGGSFGDVYRAKWKQTPVAAKCLRATGPERRAALKDFQVEAAILRNLRHPNICMLLGFSTEPGKEVMLSELMRGSLLDVLRSCRVHDRPLPRARGLRYMVELARGMNYLHSVEPPVLHRDLKELLLSPLSSCPCPHAPPSHPTRLSAPFLKRAASSTHSTPPSSPQPANLLLDSSNTIRIADFGLAALRHPQTSSAAVAAAAAVGASNGSSASSSGAQGRGEASASASSSRSPSASKASGQRRKSSDSAKSTASSPSATAAAPADPPTPPAAAAAAGADEVMLDLTAVTGSHRFMAPEVYIGKPYGRPVDVYSFSMIAFNVLETRAPWSDLPGERAVQLACKGERPRTSRAMDKRLERLLGDCWQGEPKQRPSFAAVLDMLGAFEAEGEVEPPPDAGASGPGCQCAVS